MDWALIIDIALVFIIVLCAIIGLIKGFFKSFLSFFGTVVSLIISVLLAKTVAGWLIGLGPVNALFGSTGIISNAIENGLIKLSAEVFNTTYSAGNGVTELTAMLTAAGIPAFLSPLLAGVVAQFNFAGQSLTLGQILAPMLANIIYFIVVVLILFTILKIVLAILNKFFKFLVRNKAISGLNRFFGFIVGGLKGAILVALLLTVVSLFPSWQFLTPFNEALSRTAIAKPFNEVVYNYVGKNIDLDKIISDLFPSAKKLTEKESELLTSLNVDYSADAFTAVGEDEKAAVQHFADYNETLKGTIGANGLDDAAMDALIADATAIKAKYAQAAGKAAQLAASEDPAEIATLKDEINGLLSEIDGLYGNFNALSAYTPLS